MADEGDKTFSQEEVNGIVAAAKRDLSTKFESEKEGLSKQIEETLKESESHKGLYAQSEERIKELQTQAEAASKSALKYKIGLDKGLPLPVAERLVGDDEDSLVKDAETLSELLKKPNAEPRLAGGPPEGGKPDKDDASDMNALIRRKAGRGEQ
jgi:hypothetical protein